MIRQFWEFQTQDESFKVKQELDSVGFIRSKFDPTTDDLSAWVMPVEQNGFWYLAVPPEDSVFSGVIVNAPIVDMDFGF